MEKKVERLTKDEWRAKTSKCRLSKNQWQAHNSKWVHIKIKPEVHQLLKLDVAGSRGSVQERASEILEEKLTREFEKLETI